MSQRKIVQLLLDSSSERFNYLYGLCNDGTVLGFNDTANGEWRVLPPIPQPPQANTTPPTPTEPPTDD